MSSTETIRNEMIIMYPQSADYADTILNLIKKRDSGTALTINNILDKFIEKAKKQHDSTVWGSSYDEGVTLLTLHFLSEGQPRASNSGLVVREKNSSESETEYMRPSLNNFGKYSTTKWGRQWEALRDSIVPEDFLLWVE